MSASTVILREIAQRLMRVAVALWPTRQAVWRNAAYAEFLLLQQPASALAWAAGCFRAALQQSLFTGEILRFRWARWALAVFVLVLAHDNWFSGRLIRGLQAEPAWALQFLTSAQASVVAHLPSTIHYLFAATGVCYAMATFRLLRPKRSMFAWYAAASIGSLLGLMAYSVASADLGQWRMDRQATAYAHWLASAALAMLLHRYTSHQGDKGNQASPSSGVRPCG